MTKKETLIQFCKYLKEQHSKHFTLNNFEFVINEYLKPKSKKKPKSTVFEKPKEIVSSEYDVLIDDSLWGNPMSGVLQGLYSFKHDRMLTELVDVKHFQSPNFENKTYLLAIANASLKMVKELDIEKDAKILVCRGYCNNLVDKILVANGYTNVSRGIIGDPLQTELEKLAEEHIKSLGFSSYYDPKLMAKSDIGRSFNAVVRWAVNNKKLDICKTGWSYFVDKKYLNLK